MEVNILIFLYGNSVTLGGTWSSGRSIFWFTCRGKSALMPDRNQHDHLVIPSPSSLTSNLSQSDQLLSTHHSPSTGNRAPLQTSWDRPIPFCAGLVKIHCQPFFWLNSTPMGACQLLIKKLQSGNELRHVSMRADLSKTFQYKNLNLRTTTWHKCAAVLRKARV